MAGDLHGDRLHAAFAHHREQGLEVGGLGGGPLRLDALVADAHLDRADETGEVSGRLETAFDEVRRGGLAGGSGDADLEQVAAGVSVDVGGELAHVGARVLHGEYGQTGRGGALIARRVGEDRGGAEFGGLGDEVRTVQAGPGEGGVDVAGADRAGVVRDPGDSGASSGSCGLSRSWGLDAQPFGQLPEGRRADPVRPGRSGVVHRGVLLGGLGLISVWHGGERTRRTGLRAKAGGLRNPFSVVVGERCH
ncbi:hypothetical protein SSPIM334S_05976 [Streptomyces spiroverticillatus]